MVIDKVHGLRATSISLNERFAMIAAAAPNIHPARQKRRPNRQTVGSFLNHKLTHKNRRLIEQIARELQLADWESKRQALRHRIGGSQMSLRRYGSESSLPGLRRTHSFGNLSQAQSLNNRIPWRQSIGNLSQARSVSLSGQSEWGGRQWRGFRNRGGGMRPLRGWYRGDGLGGVTGGRRVRGRGAGGAGRGGGGPGGARRGGGGPGGARRGGGGLTSTRARSRVQGRGGIQRSQTPKTVPTKEELDAQLDQYMAGTKAALDKELEEYMRNAMDFE